MEIPGILDIPRRFWRRKFWLVVPTAVGACLAYFYVQHLQPRYRASAIISVEQQAIRSDFVEETVTSAVSDRLRQIEQLVKQAEVLEPIIQELKLYPDLVASNQIRKAADKARNDLVFAENRRLRTISITFSGTDRHLVAQTANRIADTVIVENLKLRETQTQATSSFIDESVAEAEKNLRETAEAIARLKKQWDGRLPEQRKGNELIIAELERRLGTVEQQIESAETRRLLLQRAGHSRGIAQLTPTAPSALDELRLELRRLRSSYTEKHPDIIRLKQEIASLEQDQPSPHQVTSPDQDLRQDPVLTAELDAIDSEIQRLQSERSFVLGETARYRTRLLGIPHVELELETLQSRYNNYEGFHRSLLKDQIEARLAENLEAQGQSERLSVFERAEPPHKPFSPNVLFHLIIGAALGGALGVGLVFLRDELDQTFLDPDTLQAAFPGVKVLATIPNLHEQLRVPQSAPGKKRQAK